MEGDPYQKNPKPNRRLFMHHKKNHTLMVGYNLLACHDEPD
jgi:hypothetical protein